MDCEAFRCNHFGTVEGQKTSCGASYVHQVNMSFMRRADDMIGAQHKLIAFTFMLY